MKLAEALILRADCQKRIEQLKARLINNAKVQEGERAQENPADLLADLESTFATLTDLIKRINRTNSATEFEAGKSLTDVLAERDVLLARRNALQALANAAAIVQNLYSRSEIKFVSTIAVADVQKQMDAIAKEHRELDARIQALNWATELVA